jgi:hypothetical protein
MKGTQARPAAPIGAASGESESSPCPKPPAVPTPEPAAQVGEVVASLTVKVSQPLPVLPKGHPPVAKIAALLPPNGTLHEIHSRKISGSDRLSISLGIYSEKYLHLMND